jgi:hypothetical protein
MYRSGVIDMIGALADTKMAVLEILSYITGEDDEEEETEEEPPDS